jgi:hypothetical protein
MITMAMISVAISAARGIPTVTAPAVRACERFPADRNDSIGKFDSGGRQEQAWNVGIACNTMPC